VARTGAALALLVTLGLTGLLLLSLREQQYSGWVDDVETESFSFIVTDPPRATGFFVSLPDVPRSFPSELGTFGIAGTKGDSALEFRFRPRFELHAQAVQDTRVEIHHRYLELPIVGSVAGRTKVKIGSAAWTRGTPQLLGIMAGIVAIPGLLWLLAAIPVALLRKRPALLAQQFQ